MKRKSFKILVLILVVLHIYIILMRWVYWMLDWNYGHFYYIEFPVNQNDTHKVLKDLHSEILFDIYYLAFSTIVTIIIAVKYLKQQKKKNEKKNTYGSNNIALYINGYRSGGKTYGGCQQGGGQYTRQP